MAGNILGKHFRLSTFGESHGKAIGGIIDGCPSNFELNTEDVQLELNRRRTAQSSISTSRQEADIVQFLSGFFNGKTLGTPIAFIIHNNDAQSHDYEKNKEAFRPSHADYTYYAKYRNRDFRGGGRASARETACWVVGGAVAKQFLRKENINIQAYTSQIGNIRIEEKYSVKNFDEIERNAVRCPDKEKAKIMLELIETVKTQGDSIGGVISCIIGNVPVGLGEPVFDKLNARLAYAMMSINAARGIEFGAGFQAAEMTGSQHNDSFILRNNVIGTLTNNSGGIQGGISNGENICFSVAFKPTPTIKKEQQYCDVNGNLLKISDSGRHDACIVPRAVAVVEAMAAMVVFDFFLERKINNFDYF